MEPSRSEFSAAEQAKFCSGQMALPQTQTRLSSIERRVLEHHADGCSIIDIARLEKLSSHTVNLIANSAVSKYGCENLQQVLTQYHPEREGSVC